MVASPKGLRPEDCADKTNTLYRRQPALSSEGTPHKNKSVTVKL
jgi:hypothetical protein